MKKIFLTLMSVALASANVSAGTIGVSSIAGAPGPNVWGTEIVAGGTAGIVDLSGTGTLGTSQPLGPSAVKLTTDINGSSSATVGIRGNFGNAKTFLNNLSMGYSYYKDGTVAATNTAAAPSLKLEMYSTTNAAGTTAGGGQLNRSYGQLTYEPYWNLSTDPPANIWQTVSIDSSTGDDSNTASGGWWWSGGFGQVNGGGGGSILSTSEWASLFNSDFDTASIIGIYVGVGSGNVNQVGYFDAVQIGPTTYDFGAASVPEPTSLAIFGAIGLVAAGMRRRKKRSV